MYEAKNSKIRNFWTFWPVIDQSIHKLLIYGVFASYIAHILKEDPFKFGKFPGNCCR